MESAEAGSGVEVGGEEREHPALVAQLPRPVGGDEVGVELAALALRPLHAVAVLVARHARVDVVGVPWKRGVQFGRVGQRETEYR